MRFLRIRPVQKVIDDPTQLSGRGFPRIFHMKLVSSQLYVFLALQNGRRAVQFEDLPPKVVETLKTLNKSLHLARFIKLVFPQKCQKSKIPIFFLYFPPSLLSP